MKKSIFALSAVLSIGSAFAAPTTTSTTSVRSSLWDRILKNTTANYYGAYYKDNQGIASERTTFYHEVTANYNYGSGSAYIRPRFSSVDGDNNQVEWRNPRMGIRPWSYTNGDFFTANEIRLEAAMDNTGADTTDTDQYYGIIRYAHLVSYKVTSGLSVTGWAGLYENIVKDDEAVAQDTKDLNTLLMDVAVSYAFNDKHSILVNYEMESTLNERVLRGADDEDFYTNTRASNILYVRYTNSQIKNLAITPGVYISRSELEDYDSDNLGVQLELSASL